MRWVLFDLVVGAALVWLIWSGGRERPDAGPTAMVPANSEPAVLAATTAAATTPVASGITVAPDPPFATPPPGENGRRLNALARDMEELFLRVRE